MVKNKKLIYIVLVILFILGFLFFARNNYQINFQEQTVKSIKLPTQIPTQNSPKCGIESCHGLDIICGPNVPDACPMMYAAGDNCRQFVSCQIVAGQCRLEKSPKFNSCKACVEKCQQDYPDDPVKFSECESKCAL